MKIMRALIFVMIAITLSSIVNAYDDYTVNFAVSEISNFYIYTGHHPNESIGNMAILHMETGVVESPSTAGVCDSGFWIDSVANSAAYSMILAAVASQNDLNIKYSTQPAPWGNSYYCAILRVGVN